MKVTRVIRHLFHRIGFIKQAIAPVDFSADEVNLFGFAVFFAKRFCLNAKNTFQANNDVVYVGLSLGNLEIVNYAPIRASNSAKPERGFSFTLAAKQKIVRFAFLQAKKSQAQQHGENSSTPPPHLRREPR